MKLRTRLLLGYWYLAALIVVGATSASLAFHRLGGDIGDVLETNAAQVDASMRMLEAIERQDRALLALLAKGAIGDDSPQPAERAFLDALADARLRVGSPKDAEILTRTAARFDEYRAVYRRMRERRPVPALDAYEAEIVPAFNKAKRGVLDLLAAAHGTAAAAEQQAQRTARLHAAGHGLLVLVAVLSMAMLSRALGQEILARLEALGRVARAAAGGDGTRRARVDRHDELGMLADQFNALMDRLASTEKAHAGSRRQDRQLLLGLLWSLDRPSSLLDLSGVTVASTMSEADGSAVEKAASDIRQGGAALEHRTGGFLFRRLLAEQKRPAGWLVQRETATSR